MIETLHATKPHVVSKRELHHTPLEIKQRAALKRETLQQIVPHASTELSLPHMSNGIVPEADSLTAVRTELEALTPETPENDTFHTYASRLMAMKTGAEGYALWETQKSYRPASDSVTQDSEAYRDTKKQTLTALISLENIQKLPLEERPEAITDFRHTYGETSEQYEGMYKRIVQTTNTASADGEVDINAKGLLTDKDIPVENKLELLQRSGYTVDEAKSILVKMGIAVGTTVAFKAGGDSGAAVAGFLAHQQDVFKNLPLEVQLGLNGLAYGGYHFIARQYGKASFRLLEKTNFSLNAFASAGYHASKFSPRNIREKVVMNTVSGVEVMSDLYLGLPSLLARDSSIFFAINSFGIGLTAAQIGITEGIRKAAELREKMNLEKVEAMSQPEPEDEISVYQAPTQNRTIWVNPKRTKHSLA